MKMMIKTTLLLVLLLTGCNSDTAVTSDIVTPQFEPQSINIGYLMGTPVHLRNTSLLAVEKINQAGGVLGQNFNVVILQSENAEVSGAKAITLMDDFQVPLIMVTTSSRSLAVAEQAVPRNVVVLSETASSPLLTDYVDNDYLFRMAPSDVHQGRVLAQLAMGEGAQTAVMVINADDVYGSGLAGEFAAEFTRLGGELTELVEIPEDVLTGFGDTIPGVFATSPDVVIVALLGGAVSAQFINESIGQNFAGLYLLPDGGVGSDFTDNLASVDLIKKAIGVSPGFGVESNPQFTAFRDSYLATFGLAHQQFDTNVYDATMVAALALEHAGHANNTTNPSGAMVRQSMRAVMNPPGKQLGPSQIEEALTLIKNGEAVDYVGAYSAVDFDDAGDLAGTLVYDIHLLSVETGSFELQQQLFIDVPL